MFKLLLCTRYLRTRFIALASVISVMLGVATMIVVNSVMAGFSTEMRFRLHGLLSDVLVETFSLDGEWDPEKWMTVLKETAGDDIEAMSPTVEVFGLIHFKYGGNWITQNVSIVGIDPVSKAKVGALPEHLENYKPVKDDDGNIVRAPLYAANIPPSWDLHPTYLEERRERINRSRAFDPVDEPSTSSTEDDSDAAIKEFAQEGGEQEATDPTAPHKARVYIGFQLVTMPYVDKETGKTRQLTMAGPGDDIKISTVTAGRPPQPCHFYATVVDTFKSGMSEYDSHLVFCNIEELQRMRGMIDPDSGERAFTRIQIKLREGADPDTVVEKLKAALPAGKFHVSTWEKKQGPLLAAVEVEAAILNVLLFLIVAVAGFGILAIFYMIVVEKTRDIGILKSLGASSRGVMTIFLSYGVSLGIVGSGVGVIAGLLFVRYINQIEGGLTWLTGRKVFDETIYYFPSIPTKTYPMMVFWVALGAVTIAVLASVLPARRAAGLHPVRALRHE
ncbi:MAG: FtsX-like permease family protein [Planctomycetota bacterium]|nr:FtsX-like permease family protein [Planctomycetota bacterium]